MSETAVCESFRKTGKGRPAKTSVCLTCGQTNDLHVPVTRKSATGPTETKGGARIARAQPSTSAVSAPAGLGEGKKRPDPTPTVSTPTGIPAAIAAATTTAMPVSSGETRVTMTSPETSAGEKSEDLVSAFKDKSKVGEW